jgi:hypothetical protein
MDILHIIIITLIIEVTEMKLKELNNNTRRKMPENIEPLMISRTMNK